MQRYIDTNGKTYRPGAVVCGVQTHAGMSEQAWADLGCIPYTPPPVKPQEPDQNAPFRVSKLALVELLISAGMLDAFLAALDASPPARVLLDAAHDLASDNPHLLALLPKVAQALGKTETEALQILRGAAYDGV